MFPQPKRVTQIIRDAFGQGERRRQQSNTSSESDLGVTSQPGQPIPQQPPTETDPLPESGTGTGTGTQKRRKRGRPKKQLNSSALRGLARLFVDSDKPLKQIEKAVKDEDGPNRLWLRGYWMEISEAVRGTEPGLKWLRLRSASSGQSQDAEQDGNDDEEDECPVRNVVVDENVDTTIAVSDQPISGVGHGMIEPHTYNLDESMHVSNAFWTELDPAYSSADLGVGDRDSHRSELFQHTGQGFLSSDPNLFLESDSARNTFSLTSQNGQHETSAGRQKQSVRIADQGQAQNTSVQFSTDSTPPQQRGPKTTPQNGGEPGNKRKRKRRSSTSFSLSRTGMTLDGGRKGRNYAIAKSYTISSTLSSKFKDSKSEYKTLYHRPAHPHLNPLPPTPSMIPSTHGIFPRLGSSLFPRDAVAVRILTQGWAHGWDDFAVRKELEKKLPKAEAEQCTFVNRKDNNGTSPLHLAVAYGYPYTCSFFMENGADPNVCTNRGTNISDFVEPALRLTDTDYKLYFRIYYIRKYVIEGMKPPTGPRPTSSGAMHQPKRQPRSTKARAGDPKTGIAHTKTEGTHGMPSASSTIPDDLTNTYQRQPSFTKEYTISPTESIVRRKHSLPFSGDNQSLQRHSNVNTTPGMSVSSSSYYPIQPYPAVKEATSRSTAESNIAISNGSDFAAQMPTGISNSQDQDRRLLHNFKYEVGNTRAIDPARQRPVYPNTYHPSQLQTPLHPSTGQGDYQFIPPNIDPPQQSTMAGPSAGILQHGYPIPPQSSSKANNGLGSINPSNDRYNQPVYSHAPPNRPQGMDSQHSANDQGTSQTRTQAWQQQSVPSWVPSPRPPYVPPAMQQQTNPIEATLPASVAAYYSDLPMQYPTSGINDSNAMIPCPFGVAGCNGVYTCEACYRARLYCTGHP